MICNIPNRLVAIRVGPIWTMREWGTECYHPRRTLEGSMAVKRTLVSLCRPVATPTTAPPVFDCDPGTYHCEPCLIQLWKLSLKINASPCTIWKTWILLLSEREEKKPFSIPSDLKYCVIPLEGRLLMRFQDPHSCRRIVLSSAGGLGLLWTRCSLHSIGNLFQGRYHRLQTWEELITSQR